MEVSSEIKTNKDVIDNLLPICKQILKSHCCALDLMSFEYNREYKLKINFTVKEDLIVIEHASLNHMKEKSSE